METEDVPSAPLGQTAAAVYVISLQLKEPFIRTAGKALSARVGFIFAEVMAHVRSCYCQERCGVSRRAHV